MPATPVDQPQLMVAPDPFGPFQKAPIRMKKVLIPDLKAPSAEVEVRCSGCRRLLFKMESCALAGAVSIKCPRCGAFNHLRPPSSPEPKRPDRDGKGPQCGCSSPPKT